MSNCGRYNYAALGNVANIWGNNWQYFSLLAELHTYLYLPVIFWPVMANGNGSITTQTVLSSKLVTDSSMGDSIGMYGRGVSKVE